MAMHEVKVVHEVEVTGGCQCGAVRYRFVTALEEAGICHCRMCQKATGQPFFASTGGPEAGFAWTRGAPKVFRSSDIAERGFCGDCGTPLTYRRLGSGRTSVTLGSLDHPERLPPRDQAGMEAKLAWVDTIAGLPGGRTEDWLKTIGVTDVGSRQHPDGAPAPTKSGNA